MMAKTPGGMNAGPNKLAVYASFANMILRTKLSQFLPFLFSPPLARLVSFNEAKQRVTPYSELYSSTLNRANRTTATLIGSGVLLMIGLSKALGLW